MAKRTKHDGLKVLAKEDKRAIEVEIKMLLHASRDCLRNQRINTQSITFSCRDAYYGEAFGIMRALRVMNYGYFGSSNLNAVEENRSDIDVHNLKWWMNQLEKEVLREDGYYTDHECKYCMDRYRKDSRIFNEKTGTDNE